MKKIFVGLFLIFIGCKSTNKSSIDLFGIAQYSLEFNQRIVKNVPDNEIHRQVLSTYFKEEQLPIFRTIESGTNKIYLTIPTGIVFDEKKLIGTPENCEILQTQETTDVKYIAYRCDKTYTAIYLRKLQNNTFCIIVSGQEEESFRKEAEKNNIDKKILINQ
ncbi:hypothetical protein [Capnocytophaga canis]|uniref:hypothetical protein n=1 Tax=Capnocytophaga canis TaxID=1848903 RepID=UPI0015626B13|nr:hypothetical protein [Capnocytophaga canis]